MMEKGAGVAAGATNPSESVEMICVKAQEGSKPVRAPSMETNDLDMVDETFEEESCEIGSEN